MQDYAAVVHQMVEIQRTRTCGKLLELLEDLEYNADAAMHSGRIVDARRWRVVVRAAESLMHGDFDEAIATQNSIR